MNPFVRGQEGVGHRQRYRVEVPLAEVVARHLGPAPGRVGDRSARLWWRCCFHNDHNPSLCVEPGSSRGRCFGCGWHGDAVDFVRRLDPTLSFQGAVATLGGGSPISSRLASGHRPRRESPPRPPGWQEFARELVSRAEETLWTADGEEARRHLKGRGLEVETIRAARIGYQSADERRHGLFEDKPVWIPRGIVVPWIERDEIGAINVRRPEGDPKYVMVRGSRRGIYPGRRAIVPGSPLLVAEGELDVVLLNQVLAGLASTISLGSASDSPDLRILDAMMVASPWLIATDGDDAGEKAAEAWLARSRRTRRVRPPVGKDWTTAHQGGVDVRRWWSNFLSGVEHPPLLLREEVRRMRWGPVMDDPDPGLEVERPDPAGLAGRLAGILAEAVGDRYAVEEREAIRAE